MTVSRTPRISPTPHVGALMFTTSVGSAASVVPVVGDPLEDHLGNRLVVGRLAHAGAGRERRDTVGHRCPGGTHGAGELDDRADVLPVVDARHDEVRLEAEVLEGVADGVGGEAVDRDGLDAGCRLGVAGRELALGGAAAGAGAVLGWCHDLDLDVGQRRERVDQHGEPLPGHAVVVGDDDEQGLDGGLRGGGAGVVPSAASSPSSSPHAAPSAGAAATRTVSSNRCARTGTGSPPPRTWRRFVGRRRRPNVGRTRRRAVQRRPPASHEVTG